MSKLFDILTVFYRGQAIKQDWFINCPRTIIRPRLDTMGFPVGFSNVPLDRYYDGIIVPLCLYYETNSQNFFWLTIFSPLFHPSFQAGYSRTFLNLFFSSPHNHADSTHILQYIYCYRVELINTINILLTPLDFFNFILSVYISKSYKDFILIVKC